MLLKSQQVLLCTEIDYWQKRPELSFEEYKIIIKNKLLISFWSSGRDCTSYPWEISWHCHKKLYVLYTCSLLILLNVKFIQLPHYYVTSVHQGTFVSHFLGLQLSLREHACASFIAQPKWWWKNLISLGLHDSLFSHSSLQFAHCLLCSHCFHSLPKFASSQWLSFPHSAYNLSWGAWSAQLLSCLHASQTCLYLWQYGTYNFLSQTPLLVLTLSTLIFICWWTLVFTPCCFFCSQRKSSLKCDYFTSLFLSLASTSQLSYFTLLLTICRILPISKTDGLTWQWHFHASCQESSC